MTNRPKNIGTMGETGTVNALKRLGLPDARRIVLHGRDDCGDCEAAPGVMVEVKAGKAAKTASLAQLDLWWLETLDEVENYRRTYGGVGIPVLVVARAGYAPSRAEYWRAFVPVYVVSLAYDNTSLADDWPVWPVELTLARAAECLRRIGYGASDD